MSLWSRIKQLLRELEVGRVSISPLREISKRLEAQLVDRFVADDAMLLANVWELRELALSRAPTTGLLLEFGVFDGSSIRFLAERTEGTMHGFDTFTGLPRGDGIGVWERHVKRATFDLQGKLPDVPENVELHAGLFEETLPGFIEKHAGPVAFMHIDCDLYSSTRVVFDHLAERIVPGTVILFDEYFNYPGWQFGEYKAFQELVRDRKLGYKIIGAATSDSAHLDFGKYGRLALVVTAVGAS